MAWVYAVNFGTTILGRCTTTINSGVYVAPSTIVNGNTPLTGDFAIPPQGTPQVIEWNILEDFKVTMTITYNNATSAWRVYKFTCGGTDIYTSTNQAYNESWNGITFGFVYDDSTQKGNVRIIDYTGQQDGVYIRPLSLSSSAQSTIYPYIKRAMNIPVHTWHSFPSVTGKNGTFNFTMLKDENINLDSSMTNFQTDDFTRFSGQTLLSTLLNNVPVGVETPVIYAGKVDYLSVTRGALSPGVLPTLTVKIYYNNTVIKTITTTTNGYLSFIVDNENQLARVSLVKPYDSAGVTRYDATGFKTDTDSAQLYTWLHSHGEDPENNEPVPDNEGVPWIDTGISGLTEPGASAIDTGFTSMYQVSGTQLKALSNYLWSSNFVDTVKKFFSDPREIIIGVSIMPIEPDTGTAKNITAGGIDTGITGNPLTSQYKIVDMGSIYCKKEKTAEFLNYPPNTRIIAHLPYVGNHELSMHDVAGKTLTLRYLFDFLNGCCVAELTASAGSDGIAHRYFYSGSCAVQVPTSSEDFGRQYSSILSSGVAFGGVLSAPLTGGLTAPMAIGALGNTLNNGMAMSPNVEYSSGGGAITGFLSSQTAYLVVELPEEKVAENQKAFIGRPSFMHKTLSSVSGFIKCYEAHVKSILATGNEKDEIERALKDGVIIETGSPTPTVTPTTPGNIVIAFMNMTSENNVIGKTWERGTDEDAILKIEGKLLYDQSILTPKILVEGDLRGFNYCYMSIFGRFYYITDIIARNGNIMEVSLKCDPLQSFKSSILNCTAVIERAESSSLVNSYFNDGQYWTQANKVIKYVPFLNSENEELTIPRNHNSYILVIAGGD